MNVTEPTPYFGDDRRSQIPQTTMDRSTYHYTQEGLDWVYAGRPERRRATEDSRQNTISNEDQQPKVGVCKRFGEVALATQTDYRESKSKVGTLLRASALIASQTIDRARGAVILIPPVAVNVLATTHSAPETGLAVGAIYAAWCAAVGETTEQGLKAFPKATKTFENNFPEVVEIASNALPGFEDGSTPEKSDVSIIQKSVKKATTHITRGMAAAGIGTTAYVATANVKGVPESTTRKLYLKASADGAGVIGLATAAAAEVILKVGETNPELALRIRDDAGNVKLWYAVAGVSIAGTAISNWLKRRKLTKQTQVTEPQTFILGEEGEGQAI